MRAEAKPLAKQTLFVYDARMVSEAFNNWVSEVGVMDASKALSYTAPISYQVIQHWRKKGIPSERVLTIEAVTGINRSSLRPDIYPSAETDAAWKMAQALARANR